ncbi:N-acetylgalactosamine 6-sulfate sulfatase [Sphingobacteriales bacterium UPWRP_1]|nr:hypothetical protein BVG80_02650 [Sphingobacteriales bacterium TSM_CSM]PSJ75256.1 N-acetylgalactosamine 6-sulfate sulfatase [Sphingobacteriales bacterium UPWRP_1]
MYNKNLFPFLGSLQWRVLCLMAAAICCNGCTPETPAPNIIFILADDLGAGDLGCYGAPDALTPNLDALAVDGMKFVNFYAASPVCSPTRAALLSGQHPYETGVQGVIRTNPADSWGYLLPQITLLPQHLKEQGYQTALIGKWHLGLEAPNLPNLRGFDYFEGFLGDKMDDYYTHLREGQNYLRRNADTINPAGHATDLFTQWACNFLRLAAGKSKPFFLYLAYNAPHNPIQPPAEWVGTYRKRYPQTPDKRADYGAFVAHLDDGIGKVLRLLDSLQISGQTMVIFTSDNGASLQHGGSNGSLRSGKPTLYEGGLKVPMLIRYTGVVAPNSVAMQTAITTDISATIAALPAFRNKFSVPVAGVSLLPVLQGSAAADSVLASRLLYWFYREGGDVFGTGATIEACRQGNFKLLRPLPGAAPELYNLQTDPAETTNLALTDTITFNNLLKLLLQQTEQAIKIPYQPPQPAIQK